MPSSPEELIKNSLNARSNFSLLDLVSRSDSPSAAEKIAEDQEYPYSLVREVRQLAILKRDHFYEFQKLYHNGGINRDPSLVRVFPVVWAKDGYPEMTNVGQLYVRPDPIFPPVFWEYELFNEAGDSLFSTSKTEPDYNRSFKSVKCMLTAGSKSLPVGLTIAVDFVLGFDMKFSRTVENGVGINPPLRYDIVWSLTLDSKLGLGPDSFFKGVLIARREVINHNASVSAQSVVFRSLSLAERKILVTSVISEPDVKKSDYGLFLVSRFSYPIKSEGEEKFLQFTVKTVYPFKYRWLEGQKNYPIKKAREIGLPEENYWENLCVANDVIVSCRDQLKYPGLIVPCDPIEKNINEIIEHSPDSIDGLETLWGYFGFKSIRDDIYWYDFARNENLLVPWASKEEED